MRRRGVHHRTICVRSRSAPDPKTCSPSIQVSKIPISKMAAKLTTIPLTQLVSMKLIVNQAYDNMGLHSTQTLGPILDGAMRNTREGREFVRRAMEDGVKAAVTERDGPFADYSQAAAEEQPRKKSDLGRE